jgi:hypothetical protein
MITTPIRRIARKALGIDSTEWSTREARQRVQPGSLLHYSANIYSQRGDDGIIREIFRRLGIRAGYFIEFGAWDGILHSNARLLFEYGWRGLFIEADPSRFRMLVARYGVSPDVTCVNCTVTSDDKAREGKTLDMICAELGIQSAEFLSIDIDGLDLNIFESTNLRPAVVAIEGGFSWHPKMSCRVPDSIASQNLQQPLAVAIDSVRRKDYTPVCFNQNLYAVHSEYAQYFNDIVQDPATLWYDAYYFQTNQFRDRLRRFRQASDLIREQERAAHCTDDLGEN